MNQPKRLLVVDDEESIRNTLHDLLVAMGYEVETASDGFEALAKLQLDIDLVLTDAQMPGMDGFELIERIREGKSLQELPVIMVTGRTSRDDRIHAVRSGANDFIAKPIDLTEMRVRTDSLLGMKEIHDTLKRHERELEETVKRRTEALKKALDDVVVSQRNLREAHLETILRLVHATEYKDVGTAEHIRRMSYFCALLAEKAGLPPKDIEVLLHASPMHDIGKIGIPVEILNKPGKLTDEEWEIMKTHTTIGARILRNSSSEMLCAGEVIALTHHEKWDGTGYPHGIAGEDIHIYGRICSIADAFDALTSERSYKPAFSNEESLNLLQEGRKTHFDPHLVEIFAENMDEVENIQKKFKDEGRN
ncbi:MAG: response regulator [Candidatus Electryonea clarkiae]|nr:response regulator [Candidatus Electryonea clarkiae]MDP8289063.1 response regulator [Candidatus Electryonea clarkiae]